MHNEKSSNNVVACCKQNQPASHKKYMIHTRLLPGDGRKGIAGPVVDMRPEGATICSLSSTSNSSVGSY